jgi:hypothetical protein
MDIYWRLFFELPAAVALGPLVVNLLPFAIDKKFNPLVMFLCALVSMFLPVQVALALAICVPMGLIYGWVNIRLQGHEPVRIPVAQARDLVKRWNPLRKTEVTVDILTREYPEPEVVEVKPPVTKFVPEL